MLKSDSRASAKNAAAPDRNASKPGGTAAGFLRPRDLDGDNEAVAVIDGPPDAAHPPPAPARPPAAAGSSPAEIELKLLVDAGRMAEIGAAPVIAANARNQGTRRHLKSVYFDTPERLLRRNGLSLRVRQSGARVVQTVKSEAVDDPLRRGEWEATLPSPVPDLALAMPLFPEKLRGQLATRPLEPVFAADVHRHTRLLDLPSGVIEIAFDQGVLTAGDRQMPVSEIELELKSGSPVAIWDIALRLAELGPVMPSIRSKSARGFDLAADKAPSARRPRKLELAPAVTLDEAIAAILRSCFHHLLQSLPAAADGRDPEGVHQLRVALRRLRSALDLMRSLGSPNNLDALRSEARWLAHHLSPARDWDVFQFETLPEIARACPAIAGFGALEQAAAARQADAYRAAQQALADRRCAVFLLGLGAWIEARGWRNDLAAEDLGRLAEPAVAFARNSLARPYARVLKRGRRFKSLSAEDLHRVRLATKRLRYLGEFLLPLFEDRKTTRKFSRRLADLQEKLGAFNDMAITGALLGGLAAEPESATAAAAVAGWQAHAAVGVQPALHVAWRKFVAAPTPWPVES